MTTLPARSEAPSRSAQVGAIVLVLLGAVCWLMILCVLAFIVPRFAEIFRAFKIKGLPWVTPVVCDAGLTVRQFWYLFGPVWLALTVSLMLWLAKTRWRGAMTLAAILAGVSVVCTLVVITTVVLGLFLPLKENIHVGGQQ
jgi:type II secretory pathway component PulF